MNKDKIKFNPKFEEYIKDKTLLGVMWGFIWRYLVIYFGVILILFVLIELFTK